MLDDREKEMLFEELQDKFLQLEQKIEELENDSNESGDSEAADPLSEVVTGDADFDLPFRVHWFGFESAAECDEVDTVIKAQEVLIQKTEEKNNDARRARVGSGDVVILLCNHGPTTGDEDEENEDSSDSEDEDEKPKMFTDACYYVGLVVNTRVPGQTIFQDDASEGPQFGAHTNDYSIIVWETCGKAGLSCPDKPKAIKIDEIVFPEDDGSLAEDPKYGLTASQQADFRKLAIIHEIRTLKFIREEPEESEADDEEVDEYGLFKNASEVTSGAGVQYSFSNKFLHNTHNYKYFANTERISLCAADMSAKLESYSPIEVEVTTVSIMSDKCGSLKKETAEEGDPPEQLIKKKTLLVGNDIDGSEEFNLSGMKDFPESYELSLANVLELDIFDKADEPILSGSNNDFFFAPQLPDLATIERIKKEETIDVIEDFKVGVTIVSKNETDEDGNEKLCSEITIKPEKKVKKLTFHSGLLTKSEPESPQWEAAGAEKKFLAAMCEEEGDCKNSYVVTSPGISGTVSLTVTGTSGSTNIHPDCHQSYSGTTQTPYDGDIPEDNPFEPGDFVNVTIASLHYMGGNHQQRVVVNLQNSYPDGDSYGLDLGTIYAYKDYVPDPADADGKLGGTFAGTYVIDEDASNISKGGGAPGTIDITPSGTITVT